MLNDDKMATTDAVEMSKLQQSEPSTILLICSQGTPTKTLSHLTGTLCTCFGL
jgi:hypothetical protein